MYCNLSRYIWFVCYSFHVQLYFFSGTCKVEILEENETPIVIQLQVIILDLQIPGGRFGRAVHFKYQVFPPKEV
jgi:hypothetical protein